MFWKKNNKDVNIKYNFWLTEEINRCNLFNKDLKKYITPDTHPLHAKWIAKALINEFNEKDVLKLSKIKYKDENTLEDVYQEMQMHPSLEYFLQNYKPDEIHENKNETNGYYGAILGDMIGSRYEFIEHEEITDLYKKLTYTDDSVLTIATLKAIKENPQNPDFAKWYRTMYTRYQNAGYGSGFIRWCIENENSPWGYGSYANGAAMRVSPVGYYYRNIEDVIKYAYKSTIVTHNHIEGVKGAIVTAVICWMCKNEYSKEQIQQYLNKHYQYSSEQIENLENGALLFDLTKGDNNNFKHEHSLFANFAVPYAAWCFLNTDSFDDCMKKVLSHFCDADTVCAIAGSFAYEFYKVDKTDMILSNAKDLDIN